MSGQSLGETEFDIFPWMASALAELNLQVLLS
jgi:hypothetical protein